MWQYVTWLLQKVRGGQEEGLSPSRPLPSPPLPSLVSPPFSERRAHIFPLSSSLQLSPNFSPVSLIPPSFPSSRLLKSGDDWIRKPVNQTILMVEVSPAELQSVLWRVYMLRILLFFLNVLQCLSQTPLLSNKTSKEWNLCILQMIQTKHEHVIFFIFFFFIGGGGVFFVIVSLFLVFFLGGGLHYTYRVMFI